MHVNESHAYTSTEVYCVCKSGTCTKAQHTACNLRRTHGKGGLPALPAIQDSYRKEAANDRARKLISRQIRMMCYAVIGRLGHARWLARELAAVNKIRDK